MSVNLDSKPFTFGKGLHLFAGSFMQKCDKNSFAKPIVVAPGAQSRDPNIDKKADIQKAILESVLTELKQEVKALESDRYPASLQA